jgi:hypothetical protein
VAKFHGVVVPLTEAKGGRELVQHGVLPSLAVGEWPGRCDLYCDRRPVPPALTDQTDAAAGILLNVYKRPSLLQSQLRSRSLLSQTHAFSLLPPYERNVELNSVLSLCSFLEGSHSYLLAARLVEMSSSLLLDEAEVLAEEPTAEDMEDGEVSAEAEPRESRNLCRFLAAEQRILWRASLSRKIPEDNREKIHEENSEKMRELSPCQEEAAEADPRESRNLCRFLAAEQITIKVH